MKGEDERSCDMLLPVTVLLASNVCRPREGSKWEFIWFGTSLLIVIALNTLGEFGGESETGERVSAPFSDRFALSFLVCVSSSSSEEMFSIPSCCPVGGRGGKGGGMSSSWGGRGGALSSGGRGGGGVEGIGGGAGELEGVAFSFPREISLGL